MLRRFENKFKMIKKKRRRRRRRSLRGVALVAAARSVILWVLDLVPVCTGFLAFWDGENCVATASGSSKVSESYDYMRPEKRKNREPVGLVIEEPQWRRMKTWGGKKRRYSKRKPLNSFGDERASGGGPGTWWGWLS